MLNYQRVCFTFTFLWFHRFSQLRLDAGYPLVDACMRELSITGYASNHARLNAASFLAYTMSFDWRQLASFSADHDLEIKETKFQNVPSWGLDMRMMRDFQWFPWILCWYGRLPDEKRMTVLTGGWLTKSSGKRAFSCAEHPRGVVRIGSRATSLITSLDETHGGSESVSWMVSLAMNLCTHLGGTVVIYKWWTFNRTSSDSWGSFTVVIVSKMMHQFSIPSISKEPTIERMIAHLTEDVTSNWCNWVRCAGLTEGRLSSFNVAPWLKLCPEFPLQNRRP